MGALKLKTASGDLLGRKKSLTSSTGMNSAFAYDSLNRLTSVSHDGSDGIVSQHFAETLTYNALTGDIEQIGRTDLGGAFSYQHDSLDQIKTIAFAGTAHLPQNLVNRSWQYDYAGNRADDSVNGPGQFIDNFLLSDSKATYQPDIDGVGRLSQKTDRSSDVAQRFGYLADGNLSHFEFGLVSADYSVDAIGRRVAKRVQQSSSAFTQSYLYLGDTDNVLLGKNGIGDPTLYLHGQRPNEHFAEVTASGVRTYVTDHLGSVLNSEVAGNAHVFGPFGETLGTPPQITASSPPVMYGFQGMQYEAESGLYCTLYRCYDPSTGTWTSPDPIFPRSGPNPYTFVRNNPLIYTDPLGLDVYYVIGGGSYAISHGPGSTTGKAGSFGIGVGYDTQTGETFSFTTSGQSGPGDKVSGIYAGGGVTSGVFPGSQQQFLGDGTQNNVSGGFVGSAGVSGGTSGGVTGYSGDFFGIGFGATVNTQQTNTNFVGHVAGPNACGQ